MKNINIDMPLDTAQADAGKKSMIYEMSHTLWERTPMTAHIDSLLSLLYCEASVFRTASALEDVVVSAKSLRHPTLTVASALGVKTQAQHQIYPLWDMKQSRQCYDCKTCNDCHQKYDARKSQQYLVPMSQTKDREPPSESVTMQPTTHPVSFFFFFFDVQVSEEPSMKRLLCAEQSFAENSGIISGGYSPSVGGGGEGGNI